MPIFGLRQAAFSADHVVFHLFGGAADLFIDPLQHFRQRKFHVLGNATHLGQTLRTHFVNKRK